MQYQSFRYTQRQARIVILWKTGIRGLLWPVALFPILCLSLNEAAYLLGGPVRSVAEDRPLLSAYAVWVIFIGTLLVLIWEWSRRLTEKVFRVAFSDEEFSIQNEDGASIRLEVEDIGRVDAGRHVVRLMTRFGASFLPAPLVPEPLLSRIEQNLDRRCFHRRFWM